ncbi:MAG: hypothetical protein CUN56_04640 [Phototrophicales bacterium]|nr:MAG: hypothetical protein CUN56_04640 [Phototrophicales bacterium]
MKRISLVLLILMLALPIAGSAFAQDDDPEANPLRIGLMVDQSGALTVYGYELEYGFKLGLVYQSGLDINEYESLEDALEDVRIAGRPVEIFVRDNGSVPDTAASQARELIEVEGVEILVGAPSSGVTVALQQVAADYDVILFAAPGASPSITGDNFNLNTFRVCRNSFQDAAALGILAQQVGPRWMILAADYEFGRASAGAFQALLPNYGVEFVQEPLYGALDLTDFTPFLDEIVAAQPDAVLVIWAGAGTLPLFQQIEERGLRDLGIAIVGGTDSNDTSAVALSPDQVGQYGFIVYHYTLPDNDVNDWLVDAHINYVPHPETGEVDYPDLFTACSFATAQALTIGVEDATQAALEDGASLVEGTLPEFMIPALEGLAFESPKGWVFIRPSDHQALTPVYLIQIANTDSPEYAFYDLVGEVGVLEGAPPCLLPGDFAQRCEGDAEFYEYVAEVLAEEAGE